MSLENILSITGKPGLYKLKSKAKSGFVVQSLLDNKTSIVGISQNVSVLNDISIYTHTEEVPLKKVFKNIADKENSEQALSHKASKTELESYFLEVLPDYDESRVYTSDIKKVLQWYNLLQTNELLGTFEEE
jgi:hypothetical protein